MNQRLLEAHLIDVPAHIAYGLQYVLMGHLKVAYAPLDPAEAAEWREDVDTLCEAADGDPPTFNCVCGHASVFHPGLRRAHKKCLDAYKEMHP